MDDIVSIESVQGIDQLSFWSLTMATMCKCVALGVTAFMLYFNQWIQLERAGTELFLIRGISGRDCVYERADASGPIQCVLWTEAPIQRDAFWSQFAAAHGLDPSRVEQPGGMFCSLFSLVAIQLLLTLIDIVVTAVMCCHYKAHKEGKSVEQRVSLAVSGTVLFLYVLTSLCALSANLDFTHSRPPFHSSMGVAYRWYAVMALVFGLSMLASNLPRIWMCYKERKRERGEGNNGGGGGEQEEQQQKKQQCQNGGGGKQQQQQQQRQQMGQWRTTAKSGKVEEEETLQLTEGILPITY